MPTISLQPITVDNWKACISLRLQESQQHFLPSNLYSIAEAQFYPDAYPRAIADQDQHVIGFVLYGKEIRTGKWKIFRFMIDRDHQGHGYGYTAMQAVIAEMASQPDCDEILISYRRDNERARRLYGGLGFIEQQDDDGHFSAILWLNTVQPADA